MVVTVQNLALKQESTSLACLAESLKWAASLQEKLELLRLFHRVATFLSEPSPLRSFLETLSPEKQLVMLSVIATSQAERVFATDQDPFPGPDFQALIEELLSVENFYQEIGGIVGYHNLMLHCLSGDEGATALRVATYSDPEGVDITEENLEVRECIIEGIKNLSLMAEIYPVGGAADRLNLQDEKSGAPLPAAKLSFCGKTLLENLVVDLQAREYLHFKLFGKQLCTPIVMMTSQEKDNHTQILTICTEKQWFGRPQDSFRFFSQPSVPAMNKKGEWCLQGPLQLLLKPSGHGVIWKLARTSKTFEWLQKKERKKAIVRQINNPMAGVDYGLLAFTGFGCKENKTFGFAACPRRVGAAEGVNVLRERQTGSGGVEYLLTNVEYSDFQKLKRVDSTERKYANTNILFVDLESVAQASLQTPFPGALVNPKKMSYRRGSEMVEEEVARLESTMQNIADSFAQTFSKPLPPGKRKNGLKTYLTLSERKKTISTIKRTYTIGSSLEETPEGCFLDILENGTELLVSHCQMTLVPKEKRKGSPILFFYHPALGPLYSIIAQKVRGGKIWAGSELSLQISEVEIEDLKLEGSLRIVAENVMGHLASDGTHVYSENAGKCVLKNVKVRNQGIDWEKNDPLWKEETPRKEEMHIFIRGNGEFLAEDVTFEDSLEISVDAGWRVTAKNLRGELTLFLEQITIPTPSWNYTLTPDFQITLKK